jgi:formate dehydrogenase subunit gamma
VLHNYCGPFLFVSASFGHIYVGTIGVEGVFEGMWTGYVDAVWAQQHNDLWYEEEVREGRQT